MDKDFQKRIQDLSNEIIAEGYKSICFWLPARSVGGGAYLFSEYAKAIANNTNLKVYYCDFEDGYARELLKDESAITFIDYYQEQRELFLNEPTIVFTNSTRVIHIKKMHPKTKLLFWHWETNPVGWDLLLFRNEGKKIFKLMKDTNAICFHDWSSWDMFSVQSGLTMNKQYLPLFLPQKNKISNGKLISDNEINICWIGRLSFDKIQSLYNVIKCFARYNTDKIKRFHIIGDGLCADEVKSFCKDYKHSIEFIFTGTIPKEELDNYLLSHVDITFAMGTAALEAPALSIPSVVVKLSYKPYYDDLFVLFQQTEDYCMGFTLEQKKRFTAPLVKFDSILNRVINGDKKKWGTQCYASFNNNFCGCESGVIKLLQLCQHDKLTYHDLAKKLLFTPYNNLHSIYVVKKFKNNVLYVIFYNSVFAYLRKKFLLYRINANKFGGIILLFGFIPIAVIGKKLLQFIINKIENTKTGFNNLKVEKKSGYVFSTEKFKG